MKPITNATTFSLLIFMSFTSLLFTACQKQNINQPNDEVQMSMAKNTQADVLNFYTGLSKQTSWELQQVRAATAKYRNIENAIKDGYTDIGVDVEHMGHHFMRAAITDSIFDLKQPEILVYNGNEDGTKQLVAVEYAIPLTYAEPQGFTGLNDKWKYDTFFGLWLLHAWVWSYNPDGVFNPTNPLVHLH